MTRRHSAKFVLALSCLAALSHVCGLAADKRRDASAPKSPAADASPGKGFDAFQLVVERNIFNPNRTSRTRATTEEKAPPRVDQISLVGTMDYHKGLVAFFDSPDPQFRKTVHAGESVGEFKVQRISADGVELLRDEKTVALKVAQQLRRPEGGEWAVSATPQAAPDSRSGATGSIASQPGAAGPVEIPADASEVLKRLLKKRDKQLK